MAGNVDLSPLRHRENGLAPSVPNLRILVYIETHGQIVYALMGEQCRRIYRKF